MESPNKKELSFAVPKPPVKKNSESQNEGGESNTTGDASAAPTDSEATADSEKGPTVSLFSSFATALMGTEHILGMAPFGYGENSNPFRAGSSAPSSSNRSESRASRSSTQTGSEVPKSSTQSGSGALNSSNSSATEARNSSNQSGSEAPNSSSSAEPEAVKESSQPKSGAPNSSTSAGSGAPEDSTQSKSGAPNSSTSAKPGALNNTSLSGSEAQNNSTQSGSGAPNNSIPSGAGARNNSIQSESGALTIPGAPSNLTNSTSGAQINSTQPESGVPNDSSTVAVETQANGSKNAEESNKKDKQPENPPTVSTVAVPQRKGTGNTKTVDCCQKLLNLLHELRRTAKTFREEAHKFTGSSKAHRMFLEKLNRRLLARMNKMVEICKDLPEEVPKFEEMEMMNIFHEEAFRGLDFQIKMDAIEDKSNWWDGEYHHIHYYTEFMPHHKVVPPARIPRSPIVPIPRDPNIPTAQQKHSYYLMVYGAVTVTTTPFSFGFQSEVLHSTHNTSLIEFKIVEKSSPDVCIMKILILERLGDVAYINIAAPNQRWDKQDNGYGPRKLDPFTSPVHKIYEKFTIDANAKLMERYDMIVNLNRERFLWFIWLFAQYRTLFRAKCHGCQKVLHNFMPPTTFDKTGKPFHEPCKNRISHVPGMFQGYSY